MFLYPLAITLIIMGICSPLFKNDPIVYRITTAFTLIPAFCDMVNNLPAILKNTGWAQAIINFASHYIPFYSLGMGWITFGIAGFAIGLAIHFLKPAPAPTTSQLSQTER